METKETREYRDEVLIRQMAKRIKILRVTRGWSQEVLAEVAGLHKNYMGHIERGEVNIGLTNIGKLAKAFDMTASELLMFPED